MLRIIAIVLALALGGCAHSNRGRVVETQEDLSRVWVGMSKQAAVKAWGQPVEVHHMRTFEGAREQWVYGSPGSQRYLYFEDGRLVDIVH